MIRALYQAATWAALPLVRLALARRQAAGKEDPARVGERMGRPGRPRPGGALVWVHGASVGESLSALPVIGRLVEERPGVSVLVTTGTVTSAGLMAERLPAGAIHQYAPVDRMAWVRAFLDYWRPDLALWLESDLWPNLVGESQRRSMPMILLNGRMSAKSYAGWRRFPGLVRPLVAGFVLCLAQSEADARRFRALGARRVARPGNLKYAAPPLAADQAVLARIAQALSDRPLWLAASTHPGEEEAVARVHRRLAERRPGLLTILAPRHPARGPEIASALRGRGFSVAARAAGEPLRPATEIYLADTMGELGLFYRLAGVVFMGGSLVPHGGQNPIEPAHLGCAILYGPHMGNFRDVVEAMDAAGAGEAVADEAALAEAVDRLLADAELRRHRAGAASETAAAERGVLERTLAELAPYFEALPGAPAERAKGAAGARA